MNNAPFSAYLEPFSEFLTLQQRVLTVLKKLPRDVQQDFLEDPKFLVTLENYEVGKAWSLRMALPGSDGTGSRTVVLRKKLDACDEAFALYIIAHEFAHAHLHNGGWGDISDPEQAADALAESWGFPKVPRPVFLDTNIS